MSSQGQSYSGGGSRGSVQFLPNGAPIIGNMGDLSNYAAMKWNQWEFIENSLYDSFSYAAAGVTGGQILFQVPQGSGTGFGGGVKSLSDTNMTNNGMLPSGMMAAPRYLDRAGIPAHHANGNRRHAGSFRRPGRRGPDQ